MQHDNLSPFPTVIEIIRVLAGAFDSKASNKPLDALACEVDADYRKVRQLCQNVLLDPVRKYVSPDFEQLLQRCLNTLLQDYTEVVSRVSLDGIRRSQSLPLLVDHFFAPRIARALKSIHISAGGPEPCLLVAYDAQALKAILDWIATHETKWADFREGCGKEDRDRLLAWGKGTDIPRLQSINLLSSRLDSPYSPEINWPRVKTLLLLGRSIDWCRKLPLGKRLLASTLSALFTPVQPSAFEMKAREIQLINQSRLQPIWPFAEYLAFHLHGPATRPRQNKNELFHAAREAKKILKQIDRHNSTGYWFDWHEGYIHAHSHDLKNAVTCYKNAFKGALYRSGANQKKIIEEALVLAASLEKPDVVFLKRLKSMAIMLGYDIPSVSEHDVDDRYKSSNIIEDWEIDMWRADFHKRFPLEGCFPGTIQHQTPSRSGPLLENFDDIKPDYRAPNRRIKVGRTWKKTYPQLVWFSEHCKTEVVRELLNRGADVNCFSDAGDSPILMALEELNVTALPYRSLDDSIFWLLAQHKHKPETINKSTLKKKLLPIISAVESGRPDIVSKVIEMGADPNGRGSTDNQTPLYVCLNLISAAKSPEKFHLNMFNAPMTDAALDSIRRHTAGIAGFTLEDQRRFLEGLKSDPKYMRLRTAAVQTLVERTKTSLHVDKLRNIALQLIEAGADPNARHTNPILNYTPLMLAAELDEAEIFRFMLDHGGDPRLYYEDSRTGARVDCCLIADGFQANRVQGVLRLGLIGFCEISKKL